MIGAVTSVLPVSDGETGGKQGRSDGAPDASDLFNRRGQSPDRVGVLGFQNEGLGGAGVCRGGL